MRVRFTLGFFAAALLAVSLAGCGEDERSIYILRWALPWDTMQVGATNTLTVQLSEEVTTKTYVDITNPYRDYVLVGEQKTGAETLTFQPGEQEKNVSINALQASPGEVTLTFTIRGTDKTRDFSFAIEPQGS